MLKLWSFTEADTEYLQLQHAVSDSFAFHHNAHPRPCPKRFWCLTEQDGRIPGRACLGLNDAGKERLFSEYYLEDDLDALYSGDRSQSVEIGQFVSFRHGAGCHLLGATLRLLSFHYRYAVLTATGKVRTLLFDFHVAFDTLADARMERCRDRHIDWGQYYDREPQVIVVRLSSLPSTLPALEPPTSQHERPSGRQRWPTHRADSGSPFFQ